MTCTCDIFDLVNFGCKCGEIERERNGVATIEWTYQEIQQHFLNLFQDNNYNIYEDLSSYNSDRFFVLKGKQHFVDGVALVLLNYDEDETTFVYWNGKFERVGAYDMFDADGLVKSGDWLELKPKEGMFLSP